MGSDAADTGRWRDGGDHGDSGDALNGSHHTGAPNGISSVAGHKLLYDGTLRGGGVNRWRMTEKGKGWTPGPIHRMDICADGKWGGWWCSQKENLHYGPSFDAMSRQKEAISQQERGNDPAKPHKRQEKKKKTQMWLLCCWFFFCFVFLGWEHSLKSQQLARWTTGGKKSCFFMLFIFKLKVKLFQKAELGRLITQNTFHTNPLFYIKPLEFSPCFSCSLLSGVNPPPFIPQAKNKKYHSPNSTSLSLFPF